MAPSQSTFNITSALRSIAPKDQEKRPKLRVYVIGFGMAAAHFAKILAESSLHSAIELTIIGEEPIVAYNRVGLSTYIEHRDSSQLTLQPPEWYQEQGFHTVTGRTVDSIDRTNQTLHLDDGSEYTYDALLFATGSRAARPPIPGIENDNVFFYRTIADLDELILQAKGKKSAVVIGGGLLGLEAAQVVKQLDLEVSVIERADFPMPQQLNQAAGNTLISLIKEQEIDLYTSVSNASIQKRESSEALSISVREDTELSTDLVIVSTGITPNSELAQDTGLEVGVRGGIVVDNHLQTSDPRIFAIGECALVHGRIYGLVSPCNSMAEYLISHWEGENTQEFTPPDLSTRLKMLNVDVVVLGNVFDQGKSYEFTEPGSYRLLSVSSKGVLLGCLGIGGWDEVGYIQALIQEGGKVSRADLKRFRKEGNLLDKAQSQIENWSPSSIICQCNTVTKGELVSSMEACERCPERLASLTGASEVCGSCKPLIEELCGLPPQRIGMSGKVKGLIIGSLLALIIAVGILTLPGAPLGDSVESTWYKLSVLWRDFLYKQISGYTLLGLFLIGLLLSLRKRVAIFTWGSVAAWRLFHTIFGLLALLTLFLHTGFHFGENLNFWLMLIFVMTNLFGGVLGIACSLEFAKESSVAMRARSWKKPLLLLHVVTFWPLPILVAFHIISVYGF